MPLNSVYNEVLKEAIDNTKQYIEANPCCSDVKDVLKYYMTEKFLEFPALAVIGRKNGKFHSLDNRRLFIQKQFQDSGLLGHVPVRKANMEDILYVVIRNTISEMIENNEISLDNISKMKISCHDSDTFYNYVENQYKDQRSCHTGRNKLQDLALGGKKFDEQDLRVDIGVSINASNQEALESISICLPEQPGDIVSNQRIASSGYQRE